MKFNLEFYTQYNQFYLTSDNGAILGKIPTFDTGPGSGYEDRLTLEKNFLIVRTETYGNIKGEISILSGENQQANFDKYDHIVEGGLEAESGKIQVLNCPDSETELEFKVKPGKYRVRVYFSNMTGYDSDEEGTVDYVTIEMWPANNIERKVLKKYVNHL